MPSNSPYDTTYPHDHSFTAPRPAPAPPVSSLGSTNSSPSPEGFIVPHIPPPTILSASFAMPGPLAAPPPFGDRRFMSTIAALMRSAAAVPSLASTANSARPGLPCPPCNVLGVPDCTFADPDFFMENVGHARDAFLYEERSALCAAVHNNQLPSFNREYTKAQSWFYSQRRVPLPALRLIIAPPMASRCVVIAL
ncbi:hypothetical protein B0H14DRAFT_3459692 [Mycena olivaceomarginata]|nr:hypothetical protein B0H14DRAFT_3459692 [Mycena olivaceomarginata]